MRPHNPCTHFTPSCHDWTGCHILFSSTLVRICDETTMVTLLLCDRAYPADFASSVSSETNTFSFLFKFNMISISISLLLVGTTHTYHSAICLPQLACCLYLLLFHLH